MHDFGDIAEGGVVLGHDPGPSVERAARRVHRRGQALVQAMRATASIDEDEFGERTADIETDADRRCDGSGRFPIRMHAQNA